MAGPGPARQGPLARKLPAPHLVDVMLGHGSAQIANWLVTRERFFGRVRGVLALIFRRIKHRLDDRRLLQRLPPSCGIQLCPESAKEFLNLNLACLAEI